MQLQFLGTLMLTSKKIPIKHFRSCVQLSKSRQKLDIILRNQVNFWGAYFFYFQHEGWSCCKYFKLKPFGILAASDVNTLASFSQMTTSHVSWMLNSFDSSVIGTQQVTEYFISLTAYCKVASSRLSRLVAHPIIFRLFMKGNFDAYAL